MQALLVLSEGILPWIGNLFLDNQWAVVTLPPHARASPDEFRDALVRVGPELIILEVGTADSWMVEVAHEALPASIVIVAADDPREGWACGPDLFIPTTLCHVLISKQFLEWAQIRILLKKRELLEPR